jgi:hypothetical protein
MRSVETDWWIIDLPDEWDAEQDDETIVIGDEDGVGVLEITTLEKREQDVGISDLRVLAQELVPAELTGSAARIGEFSGLYFEYIEDDDAVREWLLRDGNLLLLISYSCAVENQGIDDAMVDEILETLQSKQAEEAD